VIGRDCEEALSCNSGKEDLMKCVHIPCPQQSKISWFCAGRRLTKRNKEEELVDVAPGWG
jgi:hypothetical protein